MELKPARIDCAKALLRPFWTWLWINCSCRAGNIPEVHEFFQNLVAMGDSSDVSGTFKKLENPRIQTGLLERRRLEYMNVTLL